MVQNMRNYKVFLEKNSLLFFILGLFFVSNLVFILLQDNVWWDSAVYAGMGKNIFSDSGLWENSRPVVWPLILGIARKLNFDVVFFGKLLSLLSSIGILILTYLVAKEVFDKKTAYLSIFLLALTPTFFFFSKIMLTGIISTFFVLMAVYLFLRKNYFFSGLFFGLGFMTRFLQLIPFIIIAIFLIYNRNNKNLINNLFSIGIGFLIPVVPYLILNYFLYNNIFQPFLDQIFLTKNTGWMHLQPVWFYLASLFKENFMSIFALFGIYYLLKNKPSQQNNTIFYLFLIPLIVLSFIQHKEMRFLIMLMPFLLILASYGIITFLQCNKKIRFPLVYLLIIFIFQSFVIIYSMEKSEINKVNNVIRFQNYLENDNLGKIWISNPVFTINSDKKIDTLIYYPTFNKERIDFLNPNLLNADTILLDTCDVPCNPKEIQCQEEKESFLSNIKGQFKIKYENSYGTCEQFIFAR